ncbi:unnamed protein product, partial [marine sediment metagenome]
ILLSGGTDGGNEKVIIHNAKVLSQLKIDVPIVYAGNKCSATIAKRILKENKKSVSIIENILPELNYLNIEPAKELIRKLFLSSIIKAKGLSKRMDFLSSVLMPTPSAVLKAGELLAKGTDNEEGIGDLMLIDVGNLPFSKKIRNFHKQKLEERGKAENRKPSFKMVVDDIYSKFFIFIYK